MKRLLLSSVGLILASPVLAASHGSARPFVPSCPFSVFSSIDGCSGSPPHVGSPLTFQNPTAFTDGSMAASGQTPNGGGTVNVRPTNVNWNGVGIEFAVGIKLEGPYPGGAFCNGTSIPCSATPGAEKLIDAFAYSWATDPAGAGYGSANYNSTTVGYLNVTIGASTAVSLTGFDFSPISGGVQRCVPLYIHAASNAAGTVTIKDSRLVQTFGSLTGASPGVLGPGCGQYPGKPVSRTIEYTSGAAYGNNWVFSLLNNWIDGGAYNPPFPMSQDMISYTGAGSIIVRYNYFANVQSKMIVTQLCGDEHYDFNVWHDIGYDVGIYGPPPHEEWTLTGPGNTTCSVVNVGAGSTANSGVSETLAVAGTGTVPTVAYTNGQMLTVAGITSTSGNWNGTFPVASSTSTTVTLTNASATGTWTSGGVVYPSPAPDFTVINNLTWQDATLPSPQMVQSLGLGAQSAAYGNMPVGTGTAQLNTIINNYTQSNQVPVTPNCAVTPLACKTYYPNANLISASGGTGYSQGDIIQLTGSLTGCGAAHPTNPSLIVWTVGGPGNVTLAYPWKAGVCGSNSGSSPSNVSNGPTACVDHVDSFGVHGACGGSGAVAAITGWTTVTTSTGDMAFGASNGGLVAIFEHLILDNNQLDTTGGGTPFFIGTGGSHVSCVNPGHLNANNYNFGTGANLPLSAVNSGTGFDSNCYN